MMFSDQSFKSFFRSPHSCCSECTGSALLPRLARVWLLGLTLVVVLCSLGVSRWLESIKQPSYQGRTLQEWLWYGWGTGTHEPGADEQAEAALEHIGRAAVPYLLKELGAKEPPFLWKTVYFINENQRLISIDYTPATYRRSMAASGLQALGKQAAPALPTIRRYLSDPELRNDAKRVLDSIEAQLRPRK